MSTESYVEKTEDRVETPQVSDKELNFRKQEAMFQRKLEQKEAELAEIRKQLQQKAAGWNTESDEEEDDEPYVDKRKLNKTLDKFGRKYKEETSSDIKRAVNEALAEERKQNWIKANGDFNEVMQHAQKFADLDPELAETILTMPDTFERQKLVYKNIKALGLHKPKEEKSSVQSKIDQNRRGLFYRPTGMSNAPYDAVGDF